MPRLRWLVLLAAVYCIAVPSRAQKMEVEEDPLDLNMESMFNIQKPFMQVSGGTTSFSYDGDQNFQDDITFGVVLGFASQKNVFKSEIVKTMMGGAYLTYVMAGDTTFGKASVETWRFGFENSDAFGYPLGSNGTMSLDFYATRAPLSWFVHSLPSLGVDSNTAAQLSGRFGEDLRFGESARASIGFRVAEPVSIGVGFEWAQAYERHMFWYWAMSGIIEGVADGLGAYFVNAVGKSSPMAAPIIHFIVRNGIAMGFKALRQNQMNWPFTTAAPLNYMNYQASVSVRF